MKIIGKKSASSVISSILLVIFVLLSIFLFFGLVILILASFDVISLSSGNMNFRFEFGSLAFNMPDNIEIRPRMLFVVFILGLMLLYIVHHLRKIFKNFSLEKVFITENVNGLRQIGFFTVAMAFVYSINTYLTGYLIHDLLVEKGLDVTITFNTSITMIFSGVLILIFAEIFRIAVKIAKENELTI